MCRGVWYDMAWRGLACESTLTVVLSATFRTRRGIAMTTSAATIISATVSVNVCCGVESEGLNQWSRVGSAL